LLLTPSWAVKPIAARAAVVGEHRVLLAPIYKESLASLSARHPDIRWAVLPEEREIGPAVMAAAEQLFGEVQLILQEKPKHAVLCQLVIDADARQPTSLLSALSGLLKSAHQENPTFLGQVITLPSEASVEAIAQAVEENASGLWS
jgi:hypothetical protein